MSEAKGFEGWALVEVMGHHKFAGKVTEATIAGAGFLRLDVPESVGQQAYTKFIAPAALYALTPISEDVARGLAASYRVQPVNEWDLPRLPSPVRDAVSVEEDAEAPEPGDAPVEVPEPATTIETIEVPEWFVRDRRVTVKSVRGAVLRCPVLGTLSIAADGWRYAVLDERLTGEEEALHPFLADSAYAREVCVSATDCEPSEDAGMPAPIPAPEQPASAPRKPCFEDDVPF